MKTKLVWNDLVLLMIRVSVACMMMVHGYPKLMKLFSKEKISFSDPLGFGEWNSLLLAVFAEVFCSIGIALGFKTRWMVWPLMITMGVAAFIVHSADPFKKRELAIVYLLLYLLLAITGSGKYSLDGLLKKK